MNNFIVNPKPNYGPKEHRKGFTKKELSEKYSKSNVKEALDITRRVRIVLDAEKAAQVSQHANFQRSK